MRSPQARQGSRDHRTVQHAADRQGWRGEGHRVHLRASRSFPVQVPRRQFHRDGDARNVRRGRPHPARAHMPEKDYSRVKALMFSFQRLKGADPSLGVEMASTGEVACFGADQSTPSSSMMSTGMKPPRKNILVSIQERERGPALLRRCRHSRASGTALRDDKTAAFIRENGLECTLLAYPGPGERRRRTTSMIISRAATSTSSSCSNQFSERILLLASGAWQWTLASLSYEQQVAQLFAESLEKAARRRRVTSQIPRCSTRAHHDWYK